MSDNPHLPSLLLDEDMLLTLQELCHYCDMQAEQILSMVDQGILEPQHGPAPERWRFTAVMVHRVQLVKRLQRDLDLNLPGAALAVDLIDEVKHLREQVRALEKLLFED
ncbi:MAG: chaperone modulator CbpM [Pseudomonadota bacterium]